MTDNNLFSINIPTCNRAESLKEAIPDLIEKVKNHNIKIYINDNNSQDDTEVYIKKMMTQYEHLNYNKVYISDYENANVHISAETNIKQALDLGDAQYKLLLGDHYILIDEFCVESIYAYLDNDFDAVILHHKNRKMARDADFIYTDKNMFLEELGWYVSMVSTVIYSNKLIKNMEFEKYYNSNYSHTLAILDYAATHDFRIQYMSKETTWTTKGGVKGLASWHSKALEIFTKHWYRGIMSLPDLFDKKSKTTCIQNHLKFTPGFYSPKRLILYRYAGGLSPLKVMLNIKYFYCTSNTKTILLATLISFVPKNSIRFFFKESYEYIQRVLGNIDEYKK